jgi:biotin carboxylase
MNDSKWVWMIGGGIMQLPMIKEIKGRGYKLLLTDGNFDCLGRAYADEFHEIDTYDIDTHLELALSSLIMPMPIAILTDAADVGPTVSCLCEYYDLPACSYQAALTTRHKGHMRETLQAAHPFYVKFGKTQGSAWGLAKWWNRAHNASVPVYPCVMKSCDNSASRGLSKINDYTEWDAAWHKAFDNNKYATSIIVEEYLEGEEYATDWYARDGSVWYANGAKRVFDSFGIEMGHTNPWQPEPEEIAGLTEMITSAADKLGVTEGPFKVDLMYTKKYGWVILECATRWSGGFDHTHSAVVATGRNLVKFLLDYSLGLNPSIVPLYDYKDGCAAVYAPRYQPGKITGWNGIPHAQEAAGVEDIIVMSTNEIKPLDSCADRPLFIIAKGKSEIMAWDRALAAADLIHPCYVKE